MAWHLRSAANLHSLQSLDVWFGSVIHFPFLLLTLLPFCTVGPSSTSTSTPLTSLSWAATRSCTQCKFMYRHVGGTHTHTHTPLPQVVKMLIHLHTLMVTFAGKSEAANTCLRCYCRGELQTIGVIVVVYLVCAWEGRLWVVVSR